MKKMYSNYRKIVSVFGVNANTTLLFADGDICPSHPAFLGHFLGHTDPLIPCNFDTPPLDGLQSHVRYLITAIVPARTRVTM